MDEGGEGDAGNGTDHIFVSFGETTHAGKFLVRAGE